MANCGKRQKGKIPSLGVVVACLTMTALVVALGMTGGQVRQLGDRMSALEGERDEFHRRLVSLREDNMGLLARLRDYQGVLEVAQTSNISLSKRVANREAAVGHLQDTLDSVLVEKYTTENAMRQEIAVLEGQKNDMAAQVTALGSAVAAQGDEISSLDASYREAEGKLASVVLDSDRLLVENDRYLGMMSELQDSLEAMQTSNRELAMNFDTLRVRADVLRDEKVAIERELDTMRGEESYPPGVEREREPVGGAAPFGFGPSALGVGIGISSEVFGRVGRAFDLGEFFAGR